MSRAERLLAVLRLLRRPSPVERRIGIRFRDGALLEQALRHRSHSHVTGAGRDASNERLEFLGDSVLGLVVSRSVYRRYPARGEGALTQLKSVLVSRESLACAARSLDLGRFVLLSENEARRGGRERESILADAYEALVGAVYLDRGLGSAEELVLRTVVVDTDRILEERLHHNPKNRLQEWAQRDGSQGPPRYRTRAEVGPPHRRHYTVEVSVGGELRGTGGGRTKREAQMEAARDALRQLEAETRTMPGSSAPGWAPREPNGADSPPESKRDPERP